MFRLFNPSRSHRARTLHSSLYSHMNLLFASSTTPQQASFGRRFATIGLYTVSFTSLSYLLYAYYDYKSNSSELPFSAYALLRPIITLTDPEKSHNYAVRAFQLPKPLRNAFGMVYQNGVDQSTLNTNLQTDVWHLTFPNPIGIAAGFDKHGECIDGMMDLGFGFVEIGSITPKPQSGNEKPRVWRLPKDQAVINRYGFNSDGHETVKARLQHRLKNMSRNSYGKLGVNLGKNKYVKEQDAVNDYIAGIENFTEYADYLVINISSPNTPGLRDLQRREIIHDLLSTLKETRDNVHEEIFAKSPMASCVKCKPPPPPLLVKIAPDLNDTEIEDIASVVKEVGIDGIIVSNTTISRENLKTNEKIASEYGGLSGKPVFEKSNQVLMKMYKATDGMVPLIGVGGVSSVQDAYTKIKCGASLVQLYTGLVYKGPVLVHEMIDKLDEIAKGDGYNHISEAVGSAVKNVSE
mmetsp:Transcript_11679/g.18862  ORF Transcript_11679/g.18862 Transcript_11679/m.18862 type:complete len:465 (-) Transcript_11679:95-1489(-)